MYSAIHTNYLLSKQQKYTVSQEKIDNFAVSICEVFVFSLSSFSSVFVGCYCTYGLQTSQNRKIVNLLLIDCMCILSVTI